MNPLKPLYPFVHILAVIGAGMAWIFAIAAVLALVYLALESVAKHVWIAVAWLIAGVLKVLAWALLWGAVYPVWYFGTTGPRGVGLFKRYLAERV